MSCDECPLKIGFLWLIDRLTLIYFIIYIHFCLLFCSWSWLCCVCARIAFLDFYRCTMHIKNCWKAWPTCSRCFTAFPSVWRRAASTHLQTVPLPCIRTQTALPPPPSSTMMTQTYYEFHSQSLLLWDKPPQRGGCNPHGNHLSLPHSLTLTFYPSTTTISFVFGSINCVHLLFFCFIRNSVWHQVDWV